MAYDEELADRLRAVIGGVLGAAADEKRMFGGLAFLVDGHLAIAAGGGGGLLARVDPARTEELIDPPHVGRFVMRGKEMNGWLRVDAEAITTDAELARWARLGVEYVRTLD